MSGSTQKDRQLRGAVVREDLNVSVKDEIVKVLGYGSTLLTSLEGFFHGDERRAVGGVIKSHPELFDVFERGFPERGSKSVWVRLKRARAADSSPGASTRPPR